MLRSLVDEHREGAIRAYPAFGSAWVLPHRGQRITLVAVARNVTFDPSHSNGGFHRALRPWRQVLVSPFPVRSRYGVVCNLAYFSFGQLLPREAAVIGTPSDWK
jgi:hypothetical protein